MLPPEEPAEPAPGGRTRPRAARRWPSALVFALLLAPAAVLYAPLLSGRALADYDAVLYFMPQRASLADALRDGRLPLWDPSLFMGAPFLANPQTAVLYPPSWLFVLGPVQTIYALQLALHSLLASGLTYLLLRRSFGVSRVAALFGGLAFGYSGYFVGEAGHLNQVSAAAWLPGVLLAADMLLAGGSGRWAAFGAVSLALQLLAGHPQVVYATLVGLVVLVLARSPWRRPRPMLASLARLAAMGLAAILLAAPQLVPTAMLALVSQRGGAGWQDALAGSVPRALLVPTLLPPIGVPAADVEFPAYAGFTSLALAALAILRARRRDVVWALVLCALALLLALGAYDPLVPPLLAVVPGLSAFRVPERWLLLWLIGVAVLAALGLDAIARGPRRRSLAATLVGLLAIELLLAAAGQPLMQGPPGWYLGQPPPAADWLRAYAGDGRLLSVASLQRPSGLERAVRTDPAKPISPEERDAYVLARAREVLAPNVPLAEGLRSVDGYDGGLLPLASYTRLASLLVPSGPLRPDGVLQASVPAVPDPRVLDLFGVRYVLADADAPPPARGSAVDLGELRLYDRGPGASRAILVFSSRVARDQDALDALRSASFDPNREVLLPDEPGVPADVASDRQGVPVTPDVDEPERWMARVSMPQSGFLLLRDTWYRGWSARVDGVPVDVWRADALFRAVKIPTGDHTVEMRFEAEYAPLSGFLALIGAALAGLLWRRGPAQPPY